MSAWRPEGDSHRSPDYDMEYKNTAGKSAAVSGGAGGGGEFIGRSDEWYRQMRHEQQALWQDVCKAAGMAAELPPWQIVRERRATFEATPEQNALRPRASTVWKNLFLAGDWTDTGLPATIEGSVRSGDRAADLVLAMR